MFGAIKALIKLALVAIIVHAGVKVVPVFWSYIRFRDACEEIAKYSSRKSEAEVQQRVLAKASQLEIVLPQEAVQVRKQGTLTLIDAYYRANLEYFPSRFYPYDFTVKVQGVPPGYGEYIP